MLHRDSLKFSEIYSYFISPTEILLRLNEETPSRKNQPHISTTDAQNSTFPPLSHSRCYFVVFFSFLSLFVNLQTQNAIKTRAAENVKQK